MRKKSFLILLVSSIGMFAFKPMGYASSKNKDIGREYVEEFVKEQIKTDLKDFINKHPEVVFSKSASAGTEAMQFVGYALAAYNLLEADTDKQKFFSASGLALSYFAVPYAGLIMVAAQLGDLIISMEHQKNLAKIYQEAKLLELKAIEINRQVYYQEGLEQQRIMNAATAAVDSIQQLIKKIYSSPTALFLAAKKKGEPIPPPTTAEVEATFIDVSKLHQAMIDYEYYRNLFNYMVKVHAVPTFKETSQNLDNFDKEMSPLKKPLGELIVAVRKFLSADEALEGLDRIRKSTSVFKDNLFSYNECAHIVNMAEDKILRGLDMESTDELFELRDTAELCIENYQWSGW